MSILLDAASVYCGAQVVVEDIRALLAEKDLPYKGFDMFEGEDHNIKTQIEKTG